MTGAKWRGLTRLTVIGDEILTILFILFELFACLDLIKLLCQVSHRIERGVIAITPAHLGKSAVEPETHLL
jgi:hypothetical protein